MSRRSWIGTGFAALIAVAALFAVLRKVEGATPVADSVSAGHRLAEAWCKTCHAIEAKTDGASSPAPDFVAVANQPSTTELSLKVFLRSSHHDMPNLVLTPDQADDLVTYILSLRRK
jgi:mono/diheme cytochrome c family protein